MFGGIERYSNKCFLVQVADQRATTLEAEICRYIEPDSHIMSDMWAAYANIDTIGNGVYLHSFINHSQNFVHPIDREIHTQTIENTWMRAKRKLKRQFGTSEALFSIYRHVPVYKLHPVTAVNTCSALYQNTFLLNKSYVMMPISA